MSFHSVRLEVNNYGAAFLSKQRIRQPVPPEPGLRRPWFLARRSPLPVLLPPCGHPDDRCQGARRRPQKAQRPGTAPLLYPATRLSGGPHGPERGRPESDAFGPRLRSGPHPAVRPGQTPHRGGRDPEPDLRLHLCLRPGWQSVDAPRCGLVSGGHASLPMLLLWQPGLSVGRPAEAEQGPALPEISGYAGLPHCDLGQRPLRRAGNRPCQGSG